MEWPKYPFEKLVYFVACVLPGFTALLTFHLAAPGSFGWFFHLGFLGYRTKLALIMCVAFAIGFTMNALLRGLLGGLGGVVGPKLFQRKAPHTYSIAPWRDALWRTLAKAYLGQHAPPDTVLMTKSLYDLRRKALDLQPEPARSFAISQLEMERLNSEINDGYWAQWYDQLREIVIQPGDRDFTHVWWGLTTNFGTAGLYVLVSSAYVSSLRHWWSLAMASTWVLMLVAQEYTGTKKYTDQWSTLSAQVKYLLQAQPISTTARATSAGRSSS